jgi:hypothetical protein
MGIRDVGWERKARPSKEQRGGKKGGGRGVANGMKSASLSTSAEREEEEEEEEEECFFLTAGCTVHLFPYQTIILLSLPFEGVE